MKAEAARFTRNGQSKPHGLTRVAVGRNKSGMSERHGSGGAGFPHSPRNCIASPHRQIVPPARA